MKFRKQFFNPIWVSKRLYERLSGRETQYWVSRVEELNRQNQLQEQVNAALQVQLDARERRLHPYVSEALGLLSLTQSGAYKTRADTSFGGGDALAQLFTQNGSDKETRHSYGGVYEELLERAGDRPSILEVGLGSLNAFAYAGLPPGGSLSSWRQRYPNGLAVGLDIDPESVAAVEQPAYVVDQTDTKSLRSIRQRFQNTIEFDLVVDDGFHDPHANVRTMIELFPLTTPGGYYVIEDIHHSLIDFWLAISHHMPGKSFLLDLSADRPECDDNVLFISQNV